MRRTHQMRAFSLAVLAIASLTARTACGSAANKPAVQATPAAATRPTTSQAVTTTPREFTSQRYGFRVVLTKD